MDYVYNLGNCIPRFYKMPQHSLGSKRAAANNDSYCPDIFKHSRLLAEAVMETLKKYINILKCSVNQMDAPDRVDCLETARSSHVEAGRLRGRVLENFGLVNIKSKCHHEMIFQFSLSPGIESAIVSGSPHCVKAPKIRSHTLTLLTARIGSVNRIAEAEPATGRRLGGWGRRQEAGCAACGHL